MLDVETLSIPQSLIQKGDMVIVVDGRKLVILLLVAHSSLVKRIHPQVFHCLKVKVIQTFFVVADK